MLPKIIGIQAVDMAGNICFMANEHNCRNESYIGKLAPIGMHIDIDGLASALDAAYLRKVIKEYVDRGALFVGGKNTIEQMGALLNTKRTLISDSELGDTIVKRSIYRALAQNCSEIVVVGGRSVYHAFNTHYDELHTTVFKTTIEREFGMKTAEIEVMEDETEEVVSYFEDQDIIIVNTKFKKGG